MSNSHFWVACLIASSTTALLIVLLRPLAARLGLVDYPTNRKQHAGAVPLIGGLAMFGGIAAGMMFYGGISPFKTVVLETAAVMAVVGALDDRHDLSVRVRLLAQVLACLCVIVSTGVYIHSLGTLFGTQIELGVLGIPFTIVAVIGLLNAFNMMDGIDGLAGSQALVSVSTLMLFHGAAGFRREPTIMLAIMVAVAVPYLVVNLGLTGRKIFMGDAGSMVIGYLLAWALIRLAESPASSVSPVDVLWCVAVPVLDTVTVMIRRIRDGKSPFKPDRGHIHHILLARGLSHRQALIALFSLSCVLSAIGLVTTHLSGGSNLLAFSLVAVVYMTMVMREHRDYLRRQDELRRSEVVSALVSATVASPTRSVSKGEPATMND